MAWIHHQRAHAPVKPCRETIETSGVALGVRPPAAGTPPSAPPIGPQQVQAFVTARNRARWRRARLTQRGVQRADLPEPLLLLASSGCFSSGPVALQNSQEYKTLVTVRLRRHSAMQRAVRMSLSAEAGRTPAEVRRCTNLVGVLPLGCVLWARAWRLLAHRMQSALLKLGIHTDTRDAGCSSAADVGLNDDVF